MATKPMSLKELQDMTKQQLVGLAKEVGIETKSMNKEHLIAAILPYVTKLSDSSSDEGISPAPTKIDTKPKVTEHHHVPSDTDLKLRLELAKIELEMQRETHLQQRELELQKVQMQHELEAQREQRQ